MAAPKTVATYDLNGSTREFDFAFDYLARNFVKVYLIGTERIVLQVGTDYTFVSANRIRTNVIYGAPDYQQIEIRRETSTTDRLVDFQDASILRADDLDLSQLQVLHVAEEAREAATETLGVNNFGHLDARGRRIVNVGNSVDRQDAMTYGQYLDDRSGTVAAKVAAEAARDKAKEWATKSTDIEPGLGSARTYAGAAQVSANSAAASASASSTSAGNSASSASASSSSASASSSSAVASAASASLSKQWASKVGDPVEGALFSAKQEALNSAGSAAVSRQWARSPVGTLVEGEDYSAKHYASKAEEWAAQAGAVPLAVQQVASAVRSMYVGFIGTPIPWPTTTVPAGYLPMDGRSFDTAANPVLAQRYPSGVLPDLRRMFIRGSGAGFAPLSTQGSANLSHSHGVTVDSGGSHGHTGSAASGGDHTHAVSGTADSAGSHAHRWIHAWATSSRSNLRTLANPGVSAINDRWTSPQYNSAADSIEAAGAHTHTVSGTALSAGAHTHTVTINAGGDHTHTGSASASGESESRPVNTAFMYICMTDAAIPELPTIGT